MRIAIGVGVTHNSVRVVVARGKHVLWHDEECDATAMAGAALSRLLDRMPKRIRRRGSRVRVALGPSLCQLKPITGVPANVAAATVSQLVRTGTERFYLQNNMPLNTTPAERRHDQWWAAALEAPVVEDVCAAFDKHRLSVTECLPAATILPCVLNGGHLCWPDGKVAAAIDVVAGQWVSVRCVRHDGNDGVSGDAVPELAALDHGDCKWADAFAAATGRGGERIVFRPRFARVSRRRALGARVLAIAMVIIAAVAVVAAPGAAAWYTGVRANRTLDSLQTAAAQVARASYDLRRVSAEQQAISRFTDGRRTFTGLLASLARGLPDSTALVSFHADSSGGTAVLLSSEGARVLQALDSLPGIVAAQIIGPISGQVVNGVALQRIAVRFRFPDTKAPASNRQTGPARSVSGGR